MIERACKVTRFGPDEVQPDQPNTNLRHLGVELTDLLTVIRELDAEMLGTEWSKQGLFLPSWYLDPSDAVQAKEDKLRKFADKSRKLGTLTEPRLGDSV